MIKILNLIRVGYLTNIQFKKLEKDLKRIRFFSESKNARSYNELEFTVLKIVPDEDPLNGQNYIRKDFLKDKEPVKSEIYDFNLKVCSTCS